MRLIDRIVFKELIGPFFNGLAMFLLLVFTAGYMFQATEWLLRGVGFWIVAKLVLLSMPDVLTQTFPMSMLLAGLLGFGRLSGDREIVAIFAAGISFPRAMRAVVILGAVVSILAFIWNETVVPPCKEAFWQMRHVFIDNLQSSDKPISYMLPSKQTGGVEQFVTIDGGFDSKNRAIRRVTIVKFNTEDPKRRGQPEALIYCDRATVRDRRGLDWTYYNGFFDLYRPDPKTRQTADFFRVYFDELTALPKEATVGKAFDDLPNSGDTDATRRSFLQLRREIENARKQGRADEVRGKEVDLYGKIALPLASLISGIVGAALGVNTQRGSGKTVGFGMAIFIVFIYWLFYRSMFIVGKNGGLPPILASFLADIVGIIVGLILTIRASR